MFRTLRILTAVVATGLASAVIAAAPAAATESEYLRQLEPKYPFLSRQQLLDEAYRVCQAVDSGMISSDAATMVQKDSSASVALSVDLVSTAIVQLGC